ncbi:hypothetical protein HMPREF1492_0872 [Atopobium sp. BS2]|jgi:putative membrane protein|uniref:macro domain-containing protein n=1 Tax=Atopobium sp. BS2 TaxID=936550 RepID=UPI0004524A79|nr:macro domain-containing protein [Atopobium sp. BS2]EWC93460.1 hypothetical protein HMPREF1492_0872 [Atopobium sp. BS2]
MATKVHFFDKIVREFYYKVITAISTVFSLVFIFVEIPKECKICTGFVFLSVLVLVYIFIWMYANKMTKIKLNIDGSDVHVISGDLFKQEGLKVVPFNEYFDTTVDNVIIAERSLNGQYIKNYRKNISTLDNTIKENQHLQKHIKESNIKRNGKAIKYTLGSSILIDEYVLVAFSKFDKDNKAYLTIHDYLQFLECFWNEINRIYAQRPVSVPIFGSGITRFKGGFKDIDDNELLNIMIWTFKLSKIKFKYPAKLSIIIDEKKINKINILKLKELEK